MPLGCEPAVCLRACQRVGGPPAGTYFFNPLGGWSSRPSGFGHALGLRASCMLSSLPAGSLYRASGLRNFCFLSRLPAGWCPAKSIDYVNGRGRSSSRSPGCGRALGLRACFCVRASERDGSPPASSYYCNGLEGSSSRPPGFGRALGLRACWMPSSRAARW